MGEGSVDRGWSCWRIATVIGNEGYQRMWVSVNVAEGFVEDDLVRKIVAEISQLHDVDFNTGCHVPFLFPDRTDKVVSTSDEWFLENECF